MALPRVPSICFTSRLKRAAPRPQLQLQLCRRYPALSEREARAVQLGGCLD